MSNLGTLITLVMPSLALGFEFAGEIPIFFSVFWSIFFLFLIGTGSYIKSVITKKDLHI
jgi:hypothetical protein